MASGLKAISIFTKKIIQFSEWTRVAKTDTQHLGEVGRNRKKEVTSEKVILVDKLY